MVFGYTLFSPNPGSPVAHLAAPISAIDVTMTLDDASDQLSAPGEFTIGTGENSETIIYTSLVGNVVSGMTRGAGGTTAAAWGIGTEVKRGFTAYDMFAILERLVSVDSDGVAGPASSVDSHLAVFDGAGGHIIKDGGLKPTVATTLPIVDGTAAIGASGHWADGGHIHPTDTSRASVADLALKAPLLSPALTGTPTATTAASGTDTTQIATCAFVQDLISYIDSLTYKGVIDCSTNPNYPAADAGDVYIVSAAGKIGGASGKTVSIGDTLLCNTDGTVSGDEATVGTYWNAIASNVSFGVWMASTITPTWSEGTPDITSTVARHVRNGNVVAFAITINISDGHDAVLDSISLPVAATQIAGHQVPLSSFKLYSDGVDDVVSDPYAYVDYNEATPLIKFRAVGGGYPADCTAVLNISGSYEVPT